MLKTPRTGERHEVYLYSVMQKEYAPEEENGSITNEWKKEWRDCIAI